MYESWMRGMNGRRGHAFTISQPIVRRLRGCDLRRLRTESVLPKVSAWGKASGTWRMVTQAATRKHALYTVVSRCITGRI
jgi:hypothetical protein